MSLGQELASLEDSCWKGVKLASGSTALRKTKVKGACRRKLVSFLKYVAASAAKYHKKRRVTSEVQNGRGVTGKPIWDFELLGLL